MADSLASTFWVHRDDLLQEGAAIPAYCDGAYREPKLFLEEDGRSIGGQIRAHAASVVYRDQGDSLLTGNVRLVEDGRRIHTELAILDRDANRVSNWQ